MPTLRLEQTSGNGGPYRVKLNWEKEGEFPRTAVAEFSYNLTPQDQEDMRWYFEDYLQYPQDPAPDIAGRIETRMAELGIDLFNKVFRANEETRDVWSEVKNQLSDTSIEVLTGVQEATLIPWELISNPSTTKPLALTASSFMRAYHQSAIRPKLPKIGQGPIRILLVISRPGGGDDVPFRSVASRVIKGLSQDPSSPFQLDVLRPPTFDRLAQVLREAKRRGQPYHVVHFDGHGTYADPGELGFIRSVLGKLSRIPLAGRPTGKRGYLLFENPSIEENIDPIDGTELGNLLTETEVPVLVLNACRSAFAESPKQPVTSKEIEQMDPHSRVRAFGSLAQEVVDTGVSGVVAMRYVVYVVTAAQFVARFYAGLVQGQTLGEAATLGRKYLHDQPWRDLGFEPRQLQDWPVPIVYGAGPLSLFPPQSEEKDLRIEIQEAAGIPSRGFIDPQLPPSPDTGFFGRDETLQAIDRAFDVQNVVLLHAYAGSGKTATAAEFARWYSLTGGVEGPVLFTSFERYLSLPRVLDKIGLVFCKVLEEKGVHWLTLNDDQRKTLALDILKQMPVLWIWDNVEPVNGFPAGSKSDWSKDEQRELADFLRSARETKAKFLLTSRRDEREWLGDLPRIVAVPPMPMLERVELGRAIANKQGHRVVDVESWKPLLRYTEGNPLTIAILVGQILREGLGTKEQIERFVDQLRSGEKEIGDDESQGRSKSLGASLSYGSQSAFDEKDRSVLALLSLFQGFVDVDVLRKMGEDPFSLEELRGLDRENGMKLLDRAAEVGMLTALGGGYYRIHPALPWFFRGLFQKYYEGREDEAARAFVEAASAMGNHYQRQYEAGNREVISAIAAEEANLLYARQTALKKGWWKAAVLAMQALYWPYNQTGRWMDWIRLVEDIVPFFVDPKTDGPLLGRELEWARVVEYRVKLAIQLRQWDEALMLQKKRVKWDRERAASALAKDPDQLDELDLIRIRNFIVSMADLARIQMEKGDIECIQSYKEAIEKSEKYGFRPDAAAYSMNLGNVYLLLAEIRNLDQAEWWYKRSLKLTEKSDNLVQGRCLGSLGNVALDRFEETKALGKPERKHLEAAREFYQQALETLPQNAVSELAGIHNQLGSTYRFAGMFDEALRQYQEAILIADALGDLYHAAVFRFNSAISLALAGRLSNALEYALSAQEKSEACGPAGAKELQKTENLIDNLEEALRSERNRSS